MQSNRKLKTMPSLLPWTHTVRSPFFLGNKRAPRESPPSLLFCAAGDAEEPMNQARLGAQLSTPDPSSGERRRKGEKQQAQDTRKWRLKSYEETLYNSAMSEDRTMPFLSYHFQMLYQIHGSPEVSNERAGVLRQERLAHQTLEMIHGIPNPSEGLWFLSRPPLPRALPQRMVDSHSYAADGAQL